MRKFVGLFLDVFLGDSLLLAFALLWLFMFVCVLIAPEHIIGVEEGNLGILSLEIAICVFAVIWSAMRVRHNIRKARNEN
jgi:hypothetical protein